MMRTQIVVDSATPQQVYNLTLAFQRTCGLTPGMTLPTQLNDQPTVTVGGSAMGWSSPALTSEHAQALLREFHNLDQKAVPKVSA